MFIIVLLIFGVFAFLVWNVRNGVMAGKGSSHQRKGICSHWRQIEPGYVWRPEGYESHRRIIWLLGWRSRKAPSSRPSRKRALSGERKPALQEALRGISVAGRNKVLCHRGWTHQIDLIHSTVKSSLIVVYGSYGYTGKLIVTECRRKNLPSCSPETLKHWRHNPAQSGYPYTVVDSQDLEGFKKKSLNQPHWWSIVVVRFATQPMSEACLATGTHYTDITGESTSVFESLPNLDARAKTSPTSPSCRAPVLMGSSDCLAFTPEKTKLPTATHLQIGIHHVERRTQPGARPRVWLKGLVRVGSSERWKTHPHWTGWSGQEVDFAHSSLWPCVFHGWYSTAWRSTGIPNIEVYTGATAKWSATPNAAAIWTGCSVSGG